MVLAVIAVLVLAGVGYLVLHKNNNNSNPGGLVPRGTPAAVASPGSSVAGSGSGVFTPANADVRSDLESLATVEETVLTDTNRYTTSKAALDRDGYSRFHKADVSVVVGINGNIGYCLVGTQSANQWFLYDSGNHGVQQTVFPTALAAEQACSDRAIIANTSYSKVS